MKRKSFERIVKGLFMAVLTGLAGCAEQHEVTLEPISNRLMKSPGYWISRHPCPDKVILTADEINTFNLHIQNDQRLTWDISKFPEQISGEELRLQLKNELESLRAKKLYTANDCLVSSQFFDAVETEMNFSTIGDKVKVRFGLVTQLIDQRVLPSETLLCAKIGDVNFDELQNSALDIGTPVAVLHQSADGQWSYVYDPLTPGWIKTDTIAFCTREQLVDYSNSKGFVVVIVPKADIYLNPSLSDFHEYARIATRLPLAQTPGVAETSAVLIPTRKSDGTFEPKIAFVKNQDIYNGYLPYTPRNAITQAFVMLNQPYGWGGMYGEQDCSRFTQQVFATMGIHLPRNTGQQEQVGKSIGNFDRQTRDEEKIEVLDSQAVGGITIMKFIKENHVILYLGCVDGRFYGIHDTAAVNIFAGFGQTPIPSNRVMVSDLQLGTQNPNGSLIRRLMKIRVIEK
jgi:hypothetical protein